MTIFILKFQVVICFQKIVHLSSLTAQSTFFAEHQMFEREI